MGAEADFAAAADGRAVEGGRNGLGAVLDGVDHVRQIGGLRCLAEFGDVGTANENTARAGDDAGNGAVIRRQPRHRLQQPGPHRLRQRVDRRVGDGDHGNAVLNFI